MKTAWFTPVKARRLPLIPVVFVAATAAITPPSARAALVTWNGGAGATWSTAGTGWMGTPTNPWSGSNNVAVFNTASTPSVISTGVTANGITFVSGVSSINGTGTINLGGTTPTITIDNAASGSTIATKLSNASNVNFATDTSATLNLTSAIGSTGSVTIGSGVTLKMGLTNVFGASAKAVVVNGTLDINGYSTSVTGLSGAGTLANSGANQSVRLAGAGSSSFSGTINNGASITWDAGNVFDFSGTNNDTSSQWVFRDSGIFRISSTTAWKTTSSGKSENSTSNQGFTFELATGDQAFNTTNLQLNNTGVNNFVRFAAIGGDRTVTWTTGTSVTAPLTTLVWGTGSQKIGDVLGLGDANSTGKLIFASGINLSGTNRTVDVINGQAAIGGEISGVISNSTGSAGVIKTGAGTLILSGNNSYNGVTTVSAGVLSINTVAVSTAAQSLGAGSTVNLGVAGTSSGMLLYTGATGTLDKNINALGVGGDTIQNSGGGLLTLSGTLTKANTVLTLSGGTFNVTGKITGGSTSTFNSDLNIDGATVTLSGANNDYTGPTSIYGAGKLINGINNAMPTGTVLTVGTSTDGAVANTYDLNGFNQSIAALMSASNAGSTNTNTVTNSAVSGTSTLTLTGVNSDSTAANGDFGGTIQDGANAATAITVTGGKQTLSGANTYTGKTTVSGGELNVNGSLGARSAVSVIGATLGGSGYVNGSVAVTSGTVNGTGLSMGATTFDGVSTLAGTTSASSIKASTGTLTLSGTTTSGISVIGGATFTNNGKVIGDVSVGGILNGNGAIKGALTITNTGDLAPGNSAGTQTVEGNFTVQGGAQVSMQIYGKTAGAYDQVIVTGADSVVTLNSGSILNLDLETTLALGDTIMLIDNQSTTNIVDNFTSVIIGTHTYDVSTNNIFTDLSTGLEYKLSYTAAADGDGFTNDLTLTVIPEPSTWAMLVGGFGMLIGLQKLRRNQVGI
jgi:autotransporter-associated beta strand protein